MDSNLSKGDYVLATKYSDGSFGDHWYVGFYDYEDDGRFYVTDNHGTQARGNGFRRCEKISREDGEFILGSQFDDYMDGNIWEILYLNRIERLQWELAEARRANLRQRVEDIGIEIIKDGIIDCRRSEPSKVMRFTRNIYRILGVNCNFLRRMINDQINTNPDITVDEFVNWLIAQDLENKDEKK